MLARLRSKLTYANVIASLALFVALGGVSWAAVTLPANSVGKRELKRNAVTGQKVANGSLKGADFAAGQLPTGRRGPAGPAGPAGPVGERGDRGELVQPDPRARRGIAAKPGLPGHRDAMGSSVPAPTSRRAGARPSRSTAGSR